MEVYTIAEHNEGNLASVSCELLNLANSIKGDGKSNAIILGGDAGSIGESLTKNADKVWAVNDDAFDNFNPELYIDIIQKIVGENKPALILFGDTPFGKETAPCLAVKLNAPVQSDVIKVEVAEEVSVSKFLCQGKTMVDMALVKSDFYVLTVRESIFKDGLELNGEIEVVSLEPSIEPRRGFVKYIEPEAGEIDITKEDVVVTVGRGIGDASKMGMAEDLAAALSGVTAGTRPAIDNKWLSKDRQVGASGKTIIPKFYMALGVSGASQHVAGMKDSDLIIAINKDPDAPIFGVAEYYIVGDVNEIVPELTNQIQKAKG
jgi:electron transfer flavoprotein alpha subunit